MSASVLLRATRRSHPQLALRYAASVHLRSVVENRYAGLRQFSVFNEFSKQLKGQAKTNDEFQKSVKELNEKLGNVKEDLKARTKQTTEKLYKSIDDVWIGAETTTKKVSANVREKLSAAKEEVSANVKEKLTTAREEVKETIRLGKDESSESKCTSTSSFSSNDGPTTTSGGESTQSFHSKSEESLGKDDTILGRLKTTILSSSPKVSRAIQRLKETKVSDLAKKGYNIVKDELSSTPKKKRHTQYASAPEPSGPKSTRTDIVIVPSKQSILGEKWEALKNKVKGHPIYKRVSGLSEPVVMKGQELAEDIRDRWETTDNPVVHKIQDLNETVFGETATALSFKEIRRRDPSFSLPDFLAEVQEMIRPVLTAYQKCDVETLKQYCSPEVIERCKGEHNAYQSQGIFFDNKILHISEVDVRETKLMGSTPIIIVAFQTQQIYCVRDREGSVTAGGKDTIQTVLYAWAMQQMDVEELGEGAFIPVWRLREMQQLGFQALI